MSNRDRIPRSTREAFGPYARIEVEQDKPLLPKWVMPAAIGLGYLVAAWVIFAQPAEAAVASWYGPAHHGRLTANGERFDQHKMTAAHKTLPFGTLVIVTHQGRSTVVRINDRGPYIRGREIDLSRAAAREIGLTGVGRVTMEVL